jgi:hypothetical protein
MEIGMMWFEPNPKLTLSAKVEQAAAFYRRKYGQAPTHCFINPRMIAGTVQMPPPAVVVVKTSPSIMMDHFWLGVENPVAVGAEAKETAQSAE